MNRFALALVTACLMTLPAEAAQFTFHVPVHVANIPALQQLGVACSVSAPVGPSLGSGSALALPLVNHGFDGTVTVAFDLSPGINPATATNYLCYLTVSIVDASNHVQTTGDGALASDYPKLSGQQVTAVNAQVLGTIPH